MSHLREARILELALDPKFAKAIEDNQGYLAGGCVRSVFCSESINDFDMFFPSQSEFDRCVESMNGDDSPSFSVTDTAWTHITEKGDRYQLICASFGQPEEVIKRFDYTMCMGAYDPRKRDFILDPLFLKHCSQRRLIFNVNSEFPICSLWRAVKFIKRGWKLPGTEAIKLSLKINNIQLTNLSVLKRQLMGIDTIFLKELTDDLAAKGETKYDFLEAIDMISAFVDNE